MTSGHRRPAWLRAIPPMFRKPIVFILGSTVVLGGIVMLFLPGPGILTIVLGFSILSHEFPWAHRWVEKIKTTGKKIWTSIQDQWQKWWNGITRSQREQVVLGIEGRQWACFEECSGCHPIFVTHRFTVPS